ncbi:MAG: hypothetical protein AAF500_14925 [Myxococcota bacterium]
MHRLTLGSVVLSCAVLWGCGDSGTSSGCDTGEVECDGVCIPAIEPVIEGESGIQAGVFDVSCASSACHDADAPAQGLDLSDAMASAMSTIGVTATELDRPLVDPGNPDNSYLFDKIIGENLAPGTQRMPIGGQLCDVKIEAVEAWILDGAP